METGFSLKYNISIKGCLILNTLLKIFSIKLFYWYFVNTILMTSSLKFSIKELCHDFVCSFRIDKSSGHNQNIGIIMLSGQVGYFRNPAKSCTDTLMLVQGNSDTFSATANGDSRIALASFYGNGQRMCVIRIVTAVCCKCPEILVVPSLRFQPFLYILFQFKSSMVGCYSNCFHANIDFTCL